MSITSWRLARIEKALGLSDEKFYRVRVGGTDPIKGIRIWFIGRKGSDVLHDCGLFMHAPIFLERDADQLVEALREDGYMSAEKREIVNPPEASGVWTFEGIWNQ